MRGKWICIIAVWASLTAALPLFAAEGGWTLDGGPVWQERTGPGASLFIGGASCTDDFCGSTLDVNLFGSFAGIFGFIYRVIPNAEVYLDIGTSYINTNMLGNMHDDKGFLFHIVAGGEFHIPVTGWLDPYLGFGLGYALLRAKAVNVDDNQVFSYRGVDLEMKLGGDVYPFSRIPNMSLGVLFRMGFPVWTSSCIRSDATGKFCTHPDLMAQTQPIGWDFADQTPLLVYIGLTAKYIFGSKKAEAAPTAKTE